MKRRAGARWTAWSWRAAASVAVAITILTAGAARAGDRPAPPVDRWRIQSMFVSPDGRHVAAFVCWKRKGCVRLIDTETSKELDLDTPLEQVCAAAFVDEGRTFVVSGGGSADHDVTMFGATRAFRVADGVDLCRPADVAMTGLRELASLCVVPSADGESFAAITADRQAIEFRRGDSGRVRATVRPDEKVREVLWFDGKDDLFVLLADDRLARIRSTDGKVLWHAEVPRRGEGTTWLPGERVIPPLRPSVFVQPPDATVDGSRALILVREWDETGWRQRTAVAYDWSNGRRSWWELADDDVMDELFFVPNLRRVGISHGRTARFHSYDSGELGGSMELDHEPHAVAFAATSAVGWAGTFRGLLYRIDAGAAEPR